jgi:hypothetical protein
LRLQVPSLTGWIPETNFMKAMRETDTYKFLARLIYSLRTTTRRTIWGDRLFLQFKGPTTLLLSSRGVRVADSLTADQVNEIADAPAGVLPRAVEKVAAGDSQPTVPTEATTEQAASAIHVAAVRRDGKVTFEDTKDLKEFVR